MSIGLAFTGRISSPQELLAAAQALAEERHYGLGVGEGGLRFGMCPLGGTLNIIWKPEEDPEGPWLVRGECVSTPAGAGLHRAAVELMDSLPIRALKVEDETGFYRHRDFLRMKQEHFYPWLRTLVDVCRGESGRGNSGFQLCWDLEQYAPGDVPGTVITPMGRFRLSELTGMVDGQGIEALADRFFLWDGRTRDARFFRNRAINALWEKCYFAPSSRSPEDAAINGAILDDLERAARMDPALPLPRVSYLEVCRLAEREPDLPDGPSLEEDFLPGYRKGEVTHAIGALRLTLPGIYRYEWEQWENGGGTHLWSGPDEESPVWRVNAYRARVGNARFTGNLDTLNGVEQRRLKGGSLRWGWREIYEEGERLYQVECEAVSGPSLFFLTATCTSPAGLSLAAQTIEQISVVGSSAQRETVQARKE